MYKGECRTTVVYADRFKAVAEASEVILLMLPDTPDVEAVLFGDGGVAEGVSAGKTVIDMNSISPVATRDFASRIAVLGYTYLDAPDSGGEAGAKIRIITCRGTMVAAFSPPSTI